MRSLLPCTHASEVAVAVACSAKARHRKAISIDLAPFDGHRVHQSHARFQGDSKSLRPRQALCRSEYQPGGAKLTNQRCYRMVGIRVPHDLRANHGSTNGRSCRFGYPRLTPCTFSWRRASAPQRSRLSTAAESSSAICATRQPSTPRTTS